MFELERTFLSGLEIEAWEIVSLLQYHPFVSHLTFVNNVVAIAAWRDLKA